MILTGSIIDCSRVIKIHLHSFTTVRYHFSIVRLFEYKSETLGFRRDWGTYESIYLFAKLSTLVIIAVIDPDNCLFRSLPRSRLILARQILLLVSTIGFFFAQCTFAPFLDPVNNASEWTSRLNYITTATVALLVSLHIPGEEVVNTYVLYSCVFSLEPYGWALTPFQYLYNNLWSQFLYA